MAAARDLSRGDAQKWNVPPVATSSQGQAVLGAPMHDALLDAIRYAHRERDEYLRAEVRLGNQIKAIGRRLKRAREGGQGSSDAHGLGAAPGRAEATVTAVPPEDGVSPLLARESGLQRDATHEASAAPGRAERTTSLVIPGPGASSPLDLVYVAVTATLQAHLDAIAEDRKRAERNLKAAAAELPVWGWVAGVRGVGPLGLGEIMAEAGDLSDYAGPAKVWKRFGLAVFDGEAQRRSKNKAKAEIMGFSPVRRAIAYNLAVGLRNQNKAEFRAYYDSEKARALAAGLTKGHAEKRAMRHLAKRFLRELWREWRAVQGLSPDAGLPATHATPQEGNYANGT